MEFLRRLLIRSSSFGFKKGSSRRRLEFFGIVFVFLGEDNILNFSGKVFFCTVLTIISLVRSSSVVDGGGRWFLVVIGFFDCFFFLKFFIIRTRSVIVYFTDD